VDTENATSKSPHTPQERILTPEDKNAVWISDGDERFIVPRRYVHAIVDAVPTLRHSFEHIGGRYVGHVSQFKTQEAADDSSEGTIAG
jgi:hypothetical protein